MAQPSSAEQKQIRSTKFPPEFNEKVDLRRVNLEVIRGWMVTAITKYLGMEDEVAVNFAYELLTETPGFSPNAKLIQIRLIGFLGEKNSAEFCKQLWENLLSAQASDVGVPAMIFEAKKQEIRKQLENDQLRDAQRTRDGASDRTHNPPLRDRTRHGDRPGRRLGEDRAGKRHSDTLASREQNDRRRDEKHRDADGGAEEQARKRRRYSDDSDRDENRYHSSRRDNDRRSRTFARRDNDRRSRSSSRRRHDYKDDRDRHYQSRTSYRNHSRSPYRRRSRTPPRYRSRTPRRRRSRTPPHRRDHSPHRQRSDSLDGNGRANSPLRRRDAHRKRRSPSSESPRERDDSPSVKESTERHDADTTPNSSNLTNEPTASRISTTKSPE